MVLRFAALLHGRDVGISTVRLGFKFQGHPTVRATLRDRSGENGHFPVRGGLTRSCSQRGDIAYQVCLDFVELNELVDGLVHVQLENLQ